MAEAVVLPVPEEAVVVPLVRQGPAGEEDEVFEDNDSEGDDSKD